MGNYHARCGAAEKPEVVTPEAYLSLFGEIPDFDKMLSTMRKYEISCTIILQSLSQIKAKYDKIWEIACAQKSPAHYKFGGVVFMEYCL